MSDDAVGYKRPPRHSRFKKGKSGNPKGRGKRKVAEVGEAIRNVLNASATFREGGKRKTAVAVALAVKNIGGLAVRGDIGAAQTLLELRAYFEQHGDVNPVVLVMEEADAKI